MKCPKCGAEIPAGSKFCNECGTKIEQVALFKDDESKNTEPCKCESCGNIIPNNSVFCPICHTYQKNKFSPTGEAEKRLKKAYISHSTFLHCFADSFDIDRHCGNCHFAM